MTLSHRLRRAALFGLVLSVAACDVAQFALDPKPGTGPRLVQTWNFPASSTTISVASILPAGVTIYSTPASNPPDSSAFTVSISNFNFTPRRLGDDCGTCQALNGTTTTKPAFVIVSGSSSNLPTNVVSAAVTGGTLTYTVTNNFSFDPLRVSTTAGNPQGFMVIVVRSGSLVVGRDSVNGATQALPAAPAAGSVLTRTISLQSGNVTGALAVDLTLTSPIGDHNEFINANGTLATTATLNTPTAQPTLLVANVRINVPNVPMTTQEPTPLPDKLDKNLTEHVISGAIEMTITNPFAVAGTLSARFAYGTQPAENVTKTFALPTTASPQVREIPFNGTEMRLILCGGPPMQDFFRLVQCPQTTTTTLTMTGGVTSAAPILVTPKQAVTISNRLVLTVRVGGGT